ncbi:MAG: hypothetical protein IIA12_01180 [Proteobacteria bacterium]|nr:hypothetical protein [Pseudomonadota bacterium]
MSSYGRFKIPNILILLVAVIGIASVDTAEAQNNLYPVNVDPNQFHPGYYAMIGDWNEIPIDILLSADFVGVKILYLWRTMEPSPNNYDFSSIEEDLARLEAYDKRLWIQIEYTQWNSNVQPNTPDYMWSDPTYGGDPRFFGNYQRSVQAGGWYPMFWNSKVRNQLNSLVSALGERFNSEPYVEGIVIGETSASVPDGYECGDFLSAFQEVMLTAKNAFIRKSVLQMVNFACFDLPDYIRWLVNRGIGLGTPDTFNFKVYLTQTIYPLMFENRYSVPMGPDVQWDNYTRNNMSVREIRDFAIANMDPWYLFWQVRQPYFDDEVLRAVFARPLPAAERFYAGYPPAKRPKPPVLLD